MEILFKEFDSIYLELSWKWLNDPEIKYLTNTSDFTREQQREWFDSLAELTDYLIWGLEADSVPIGVCGLKNITNIDCEYWGYIGEKQYWGIGIGKEMMLLLEAKARDFGKTSIWLEVIKENPKAISLYKKLGYSKEAESNDLIKMRKIL